MTTFGFDPRGAGARGGSGGQVSPPPLHSASVDSAGHASVLGDVYRAGIDPAAAFGAAAGMHKVLGSDTAQNWMKTIKAGVVDEPQTTPQTSLDGSAGSPMDDETQSHETDTKSEKKGDTQTGKKSKGGGSKSSTGLADKAAKDAAAKEASAELEKRMTTKGLVRKGLEKGAGALAASRGAKVAAAVGLRMAAVSIPGLGTAITAACWMLDSSERSEVNNLISRVMGPGAAPDLDAAPEPPRTMFLPLTHDGNRDPSIVKMDQGMVHTNDAAFHFHPDDVWPSAPRIETTSDFSSVASKINTMSSRVDTLAQSIRAAYTTAAADEPYLQQLWSTAKPGVDAIEGLKDTVLPAIGRQLMDGAINGNDAYQALREVNRINREEINNSTSGMFAFRANHINESKMSDSTAQLRSAVEAMDRTAQALALAADPFTVTERHLAAPTAPTTPTPPVGPPATLAPEGLGVGSGAGQPPARPPAVDKIDPQAKDLASLLRSGMPSMPGMGMPTLPSMPGMGGMPQMPGGLGNMAPRPAEGMLANNPLKQDQLKKALDEQLKDKQGDDKAAKKPGDGQIVGGLTPGAAQSVSNKPGPPLGAPGTPGGPSGAANTTEVGGKKWTFDNPKAAALAHNLTGTDGSGHKSLRQAASEAGFRLPPTGQDIGERVPGNGIKPGDVVMGPNNENAYYLGAESGKDMVITERGELKPLDEVAKGFTGPHEGIFRLADDGTPAPEQQTIHQAAAHADAPAPPPAPPAAPPSTATGVIPTPPAAGAGGGLDSSSVPSGN